MKKLIVLVFPMLLLNACNTMEGLGKDVQKVGAKVEEAARR